MESLDAPGTRYRVNDSIARLRDVVNYPGNLFNALVMDRARWTRLCVAMDVATDTEDAIQTYIDTNGNQVGYLHYYGLIDSWVVQQDAVGVVRDELLAAPRIYGIDNTEYLELLRNRRLRNRLLSHPMSANIGNGNSAAVGIIQVGMGKWHLSYLEWRDGECAEHTVDLRERIAAQRRDIAKLIAETANEYGRIAGIETDAENE